MRIARRSLHLAVVLSLTAGIALLPGARARATFPGPNGRIAFWDFMSGQIYAVNPDGSGLLQLTHAPEGHYAAVPRWSPDSSHIVFESDMSGPVRIWMMDATGADQHQIVGDRPGFADFAPSYTPNGRRIVYTRCLPDGGCALWQVRADGTHRVALTPFQDEVFDFAAAVSPDGRRIAFGRFSAGGVIGQIYVMASDGSDPQPVTPAALEAFNPTWSPDGRYILFGTNCCKANSDVFVMKPNGTGIHALTATEFPANSVPGSFSPQDDQIVFASDRNYGDFCCVDLFLMRANGTHESVLPTGILGALDPQWGSAPIVASNVAAPAVVSAHGGTRSLCRGFRALITTPCS
jgi:Tol biopolymer transport system component